jgi:predicted amidohydrolase YtcJ
MMRRYEPRFRTRAPWLGAALLALVCGTPALAQQADMVLLNGRVDTPSGWRQALAIRDGSIVAVGSDAEIRALRGGQTRVVDLAGKTVLPGFHDMHVHPQYAGQVATACQVPQGVAASQIIAAVEACVALHQPGEWIVANYLGGEEEFGGRVSRFDLDAVAPRNPVVIFGTGGHSAWASTAVLRAAKMLDARANLAGVDYDASGQPTGLLRETATLPVREAIPQPTVAQRAASIQWALDRLVSDGFTAITDAEAEGLNSIAAYSLLENQGALKPRTRLCFGLPAPDRREALLAALSGTERRAGDARLAMDCIKIYVDGAPTDIRTAAMVEPYLPKDGKADDHGTYRTPPDELARLVTRFDADGFTVKMHAMGDAAVKAALDAVEQARWVNGPNGRAHEIAHASLMRPEDFPRGRALNATFEFSPVAFFQPLLARIVAAQIGDARASRLGPVREALDAGAMVVAGSDWPSGPEEHPWRLIEILVTRGGVGSEAGPNLSVDEQIGLREALDLFTINAARQLGRADKAGSIAPGKWADLTIVDRNPFDLPADQLHTIRNMMTMIGGKVVYEAPPR